MKTGYKGLVLLLLMVSLPACAQDECASPGFLKSHAGHYAKKAFWDNLPAVKNWQDALRKFNSSDSSAININNTGMATMIFGWHEGGTVACASIRESELWVKETANPNSKWVGPFVRIGPIVPPYAENQYYFDKLFGNDCYTSNKNERWCFHSGAISIDSKLHPAELVLDTNEMPETGTPVTIDKDDVNTLIFIPISHGLKVFRYTLDPERGYSEIDPDKTPLWRILSR